MPCIETIFACQKALSHLNIRAPRNDSIQLEQKGRLSRNIIDEAYELPCHTVYLDRFGSLREAYSRIGYCPDSLKHYDGRHAVVATLVEVREEFVESLEAAGSRSIAQLGS